LGVFGFQVSDFEFWAVSDFEIREFSDFEFRISDFLECPSFFISLPFVGVPASLGPGLRTVSGTKRGTGPKLSGAIPAMTGKSASSRKMLLALAIAEGTSVAEWALDHGVPERTAYRWAAEPEIQAEVEAIRRRFLDRAIGLLAKNSTSAVHGIVDLSGTANSESVKLSAHKAVLSEFIAVSKYTGIERRIAKLEEQNRARARNAT
jgi:hypothetical protein